MKVIKGAFVRLSAGLNMAVPEAIFFQFNPETLLHRWSQPIAPAAANGHEVSDAFAIPGLPSETFSFNLAMDVADGQVSLNGAPCGIYGRLAALEMLMFPDKASDQQVGTAGGAGAGSVPGGSGNAGGGSQEPRGVPATRLPIVLFVWGATRILPVRLTSLAITEKLYDAYLNPTHAEAQIELRVVTRDELRPLTGLPARLAAAAYEYSQGQRTTLAMLQLARVTLSEILNTPSP